MKPILTREELADVARLARGFVYNDFGGADPKMCPVHSINCGSIDRMLDVKPGKLSVKKMWATELADLLDWLRDHQKPHALCSKCNPRDIGTSRSSPAIRSRQPDASTGFLVLGPLEGVPMVQVWSGFRLPFEPKGDAIRLRDDVRDSLSRLDTMENRLCYGVYVSTSEERCDAENVLFYNVGPSAFTRLADCGLCFERAFAEVPEAPQQLPFEARHYHRYELIDSAQPWRRWLPGTEIARGEARLPDNPCSASAVWWAFRNGTLDVSANSLPTNLFGLCLEVYDDGRVHNLAAAMKTLFDGFVASLHVHDGTRIHDCSARLASLLGEPADLVQHELEDARCACLGERCLIWPWGSSVQWNPGDDACVAGLLRRGQGAAGRPRLVARLFSVSSA